LSSLFRFKEECGLIPTLESIIGDGQPHNISGRDANSLFSRLSYLGDSADDDQELRSEFENYKALLQIHPQADNLLFVIL
jgi:hypothetical protein